MRPYKYILVDKKVTAAADLMEWATWFETSDRRVGYDELPNGYRVSTIFLGLDHNFGEGEPLVFETMVFLEDGFREEAMERYSTYEQAEWGHKKMVAKWRKHKPSTKAERTAA